MRNLLRRMVPTRFEDISAVLALYRPGPMGAGAHNDYADRKNARQEVRPIHSELAEPLADILDETFGLIVYQEQVIAIAQRVPVTRWVKPTCCAGRWARRRRKSSTRSTKLSGGMSDAGYSTAAIKALWDILLPFSDYAFNRAHSAGYGLVSCWTAYLKAKLSI